MQQDFPRAKLFDSIFAQNVLAVRRHHTCHQTTKRCDAIALANYKHCCIDMSGSRLKSAVGVCNGASCIIVEMRFDVAIDSCAEGPDLLGNIHRSSRAHGIGNTNAINS